MHPFLKLFIEAIKLYTKISCKLGDKFAEWFINDLHFLIKVWWFERFLFQSVREALLSDFCTLCVSGEAGIQKSGASKTDLLYAKHF